MWSQERHQRIQALLETHRRVAGDDLSRTLGVSRETIRRDLLELESAGMLRRVHGGAILAEPAAEEPFRRRLHSRRRQKQAIARTARQLIRPGQSCFVDAGSTTALLAEELGKLAGIIVITNSLDVATTLRRLDPGTEVLLLGGRLVSDVPATFGELTLAEIRRFHVDLAFLSPVGLHPDRGATSFDFAEAEVARTMIENSTSVVILADHDKIGRTSRVQVCDCARIATLVTDSETTAEERASFSRAGVAQILTAA